MKGGAIRSPVASVALGLRDCVRHLFKIPTALIDFAPVTTMLTQLVADVTGFIVPALGAVIGLGVLISAIVWVGRTIHSFVQGRARV